MKLDLSRDFLDGIMLQHPRPADGKGEVKVNAGLHFLPSSPDGKLHTGVVTFVLQVESEESPFARGGWRFLFTSSEALKPQEQGENPFFKNMLMTGINKITTVLNPLCLHANLPTIPLDAARIADSVAAQKSGQQGDGGDQSIPMP